LARRSLGRAAWVPKRRLPVVWAIGEYLPWAISGTYLEACNCDPICPCRTINGRPGGRSTHGICMFALSWQIVSGHAGDVDLAGLRAVLAARYDDDEPGSPWSFYLHVD
jgi:hypothetical protein